MKKAIVILLFIVSTAYYPTGTTQAGNQQPEWEVKAEEGDGGVEIELTAFNNTPDKMILEFPSSQFFDYIVMDHSGKEVYRYSDNKAFLPAVQRITLKSGEQKIWQSKWDHSSSYGQRIPPGEYMVEAFLQVKQVNGKPVEERIGQTMKLTIEEQNPSFKNVKMVSSGNSYCVRGQAKVSAGSFYYTVEDGHNILKEETMVKVNKESPNWSEFEFCFDLGRDEIAKNRPVLLNLYERDLEDGTVHHNYTVEVK
ncbi:hypothetical protein FZC78_14795 [Rossellomorea vietnamensis]|uniref:Intracellular proteinase inhibitor BsuPI domain-containing protein n=1 Tax=Rossellomorea vietnamensis TaxID=218284 RepID=A0A5D4NPN3_9BACI|nr:BsuPI-related putative proteinase inhibitor [Rossellomorea vietnamensis]TYS15849.1 hypothetical protein FZC78_14795 [Rossellomorea vietnamensis]